MKALQPRHWQVLLSIRLLMEIPSASSLAVLGEEDVNARPVRARRRKRHANAVCITRAVLRRKVLAAPAVVDVLVAVVSVNSQTAAVPSWKTEGWIGEGSEAQSQVDSGAIAANSYLVVNSLWLFGRCRVVLVDHVERRVADDAAIGAILVCVALPVARRKKLQGAIKARRLQESEVVELQRILARLVEHDGPDDGILSAPLLASLCLLLRRIIGR